MAWCPPSYVDLLMWAQAKDLKRQRQAHAASNGSTDTGPVRAAKAAKGEDRALQGSTPEGTPDSRDAAVQEGKMTSNNTDATGEQAGSIVTAGVREPDSITAAQPAEEERVGTSDRLPNGDSSTGSPNLPALPNNQMKAGRQASAACKPSLPAPEPGRGAVAPAGSAGEGDPNAAQGKVSLSPAPFLGDSLVRDLLDECEQLAAAPLEVCLVACLAIWQVEPMWLS